jgi:hypothetical protein
MTREKYIQEVDGVLAGYTEQAADRLGKALALVPPKTRSVEIVIFIDQDGEGFLEVRVSLDGPDLFILNKAIESHAELFETRMTDDGLEPPLPLMDPDDETFSVHDALTDRAASWILAVWQKTERANFHLPVTVVSHDGDGTLPPFKLN